MVEPDFILEDARGMARALPAERLAGQTVLLTGASGIVGTYFLAALRLLADGPHRPRRVIAVMRREPPPHILPWLSRPPFEVRRCDLADPAACRDLPGASLIIHAAGYGQPGKFLERPLATLSLNATATAILIEKLEPQGRFLFVSTSEVYSGLSHPPFREDQIGATNTDHPRACYIEGKRCGEAICHAARQQGIAAVAARLALAYGPGTQPDDQRVLNVFIRRACVERRIRLLDGGNALRTYCYVTDAVRLMWLALLAGRHALYNIGGISTVSIRELAELIGRLAGVPVEVPLNAKPLPGAPDNVKLDLSRVEAEFGPLQFVSLEEGASRTLRWQKQAYYPTA